MTESERSWKIGELAQATGLTVRTLHHYDHLGLLSPGMRTESGHRCYTGEGVRRLHTIVAMRSLGISLEQIGGLLDGAQDPIDMFRRQLEVVEERVRQAVDLRCRLLDLLESLSRNVEPTTQQLLQLIEETVTMNEPLTAQQFVELNEVRERQIRDLSDEDFAALKEKMRKTWNGLSNREQDRLIEKRRRMVPAASEGEA
jgi:MerR family transcriptional regulator, thiopeptide resistance regulator